MKCENCKREVPRIQSIKPFLDISVCDDCVNYARAGVVSCLKVAAALLPVQS